MLLNSLTGDISEFKQIQRMNYWQMFVQKYIRPRRYNIERKSLIRIEKELDLQKIIHRLRIVLFTSMGLLTADQSVYVDKLSHVVVNESSDNEETSDDDELKEFKAGVDLKIAVRRMLKSTKEKDKRFMNIYRVNRAQEKGYSLALNEADMAKIENMGSPKVNRLQLNKIKLHGINELGLEDGSDWHDDHSR